MADEDKDLKAPAEDAPSPEPSEADKLRAELETERKARAEEVNQLKGAIAGLSALGATPPSQAQPADDDDEPTEEEFITSPKSANAKLLRRGLKEFARVLAPHLESISTRQFDQEYKGVRSANPKVFDKIKPQIDQYFAQNPQARNVPGEVERAYKHYLGENFDSLVAELNADKLKEPKFAAPAKGGDAPKASAPVYEDWEILSMKKFGLSPEQWEETKKKGARRR